MNQAFLTGIVGIQTHQYGIDVLADNIANINTVGFRASRTEFGSLFESALNSDLLGSPTYDSIGVGSRVQATTMREEVGVMLPSDKTSSLAIEGEGWFGVSQGRETYYTRSGNFLFDADRNLVTTDGYYVMGSMAGNISNGELTHVVDTVELSGVEGQVLLLPGSLTFPGEPSTVAHFKGNLGIDAIDRLVSAEVIDPNNTSNRLALRFEKSAVQPAEGTAWDITASIANRDGSTIYDSATGTATFSGNGSIIDYSLPTMNNNGAPLL